MALVFVLVAIIALCLYFLPTLVAAGRHTTNGGGVLVLNLFFGWTLLGWVIALALAAGGATRPTMSARDLASEVRNLEELHEDGVISTREWTRRFQRLTG